MNTKIVYVLVSSDKDIYLEQAYVSMYSVKYYMPDAHIVLLTDKLTSETFVGVRKKEIQYANEIISIDLDGLKYTPKQRSRLLKSGARLYVEGNFLFIDCDTIITKSLAEIDEINADIAACWDSHTLLIDSPQYERVIRDGKKLDWPIQKEKEYFNSGVIFVRDNKKTYDFYELWQSLLKQSQEKGIDMDQPSFAKTNYKMNHVIQTLDDTWNCELKYGIRYLKDAKIVHYLCTNKSHNNDVQFFLLNEYTVLEKIKKTGIIPIEVEETIKDPFKGIARVVHCFAGKDIFFFETSSFHKIRSLYDTSFFSFSSKLLEILFKIHQKQKILTKIWSTKY